MSKFQTTLQDLPTIVKYALVGAAVIFISTLFPSHNNFPYAFEVGEKWAYEDLQAPIDFEIKKSLTEIDLEKGDLEKEVVLLFQENIGIEEKQKIAFKEAFYKKLELEGASFTDVPKNPLNYLNEGNALLKRIYKKGVVQIPSTLKTFSPNIPIYVVQKFGIQKREIKTLQTNQNASQEVIDLLYESKLPEADFLVSLLGSSFFKPSYSYSESLTKKFKNDLVTGVSTIKGTIAKNDLIISKGDEITETSYETLSALRNQYGNSNGDSKYSWGVFFGYFLLTSLVIGVFLFYLQFDAVEIFDKYSNLIFILIWVVLYSYLVYTVEATNSLNAFMIPFCIGPIVLKSFFDERVALFTHIVIVLIASILSSEGYEFTFLQLLAGIVAVLTPIQARDWTKFFYFLLTIFGTYVLGFLGLSLISRTGFDSMGWSTYGWIFWSVFLTLLAYPLIPLSERLFGFTSSISLLELSDINRPLLKKLAQEAPGTFQHSLQVGNLAEAAANRINADGVLIKVAALYHDIGKLKQPEFFIENQSGKNPHDNLDPLESAKIILEHVTEGERLAKKNRLPTPIIDFINTHHGTTRVEYFYKKYKTLNPNQEIDEKDFKYSGPLPKSKETTILMIADSVEAAAKSLKMKNEETFLDLVNDIIQFKIEMGQLAVSELTFEELESCKDEFVKTLKSIYHVRVAY